MWPLEIGTKIAVETTIEELCKDNNIRKVYFISGNKEQAEIYKKLVETIED